MVHRNAPLSELGRLRLARCVVDERWPLRRAAERFQVSPTTAARWAGRYRACGEAGMVDRSSRPHRSPRRTPTRTERRIIKVRVLRRWGPARIGYLLGIHPSTVHRVLTRYRLAKLRWLDRPDRARRAPYRAGPLRGHGACRRQEAGQDPHRRRLAHARAHRGQPQFARRQEFGPTKQARPSVARSPLPAHGDRRSFSAGVQRTAGR